MERVRVKGFRGFKNMAELCIKPITVLVGKNSSGKSSLLRTLPLFKQSTLQTLQSPLLFYGEYVDFGRFEDSLCNSEEVSSMDFGLSFITDTIELSESISNYRRSYNRAKNALSAPINIDIDVRLGKSKHNKLRMLSFLVNIGDQSIYIEIDEDKRVTSLIINEEEFTQFTGNVIVHDKNLVPTLILNVDEHNASASRLALFRWEDLTDTLYKRISSYVHGNTLQDTVIGMANSLQFGTKESVLLNCQTTQQSISTWRTNVKNWTVEAHAFKKINNAIVFARLPYILRFVDGVYHRSANAVNYIGPFRATPERYYRHQELSVANVNPTGNNLAMFIDSLTDTDQEKLLTWTKNNFGFSIKLKRSSGHVSITIAESGGIFYNIADIGFGFSQVLPIIVQAWYLLKKRPQRFGRPQVVIMAIEQPELHLHPRMIGMLADLFVTIVSMNRSAHSAGTGIPNIRFVIETHSKTLISRIGDNIASRKINADDVSVNIFKEDGEGFSSVSTAFFTENGALNNWPANFFLPEK